MELTNEFQVPVPIDQAWTVLTDVERIAPCLPGAQLDEVAGDEYHGTVKVKVGPISATYKGTAHFLERDDTAHKAVLRAEGRETRGQGNANATITAQLSPAADGGTDGGSTTVSVVTDLQVAGRVAQFGRGVLADVSTRLLGQFTTCLESKLQTDETGASGGSAEAGASAASGRAAETTSAGAAAGGGRASSGDTAGEAEAVDLLDTAGSPVAKRILPVAAGAAALGGLFVLRRFRRRRRR